jgi:hypothetical protein
MAKGNHRQSMADLLGWDPWLEPLSSEVTMTVAKLQLVLEIAHSEGYASGRKDGQGEVCGKFESCWKKQRDLISKN